MARTLKLVAMMMPAFALRGPCRWGTEKWHFFGPREIGMNLHTDLQLWPVCAGTSPKQCRALTKPKAGKERGCCGLAFFN